MSVSLNPAVLPARAGFPEVLALLLTSLPPQPKRVRVPPQSQGPLGTSAIKGGVISSRGSPC